LAGGSEDPIEAAVRIGEEKKAKDLQAFILAAYDNEPVPISADCLAELKGLVKAAEAAESSEGGELPKLPKLTQLAIENHAGLQASIRELRESIKDLRRPTPTERVYIWLIASVLAGLLPVIFTEIPQKWTMGPNALTASGDFLLFRQFCL